MPETLTPRAAAKAYAALAVATVVALLTAIQAVQRDGMTTDDWLTVALAALGPLAAFVATWAVPNEPPAPASQPPVPDHHQ
jgi:hypothetical protein